MRLRRDEEESYYDPFGHTGWWILQSGRVKINQNGGLAKISRNAKVVTQVVNPGQSRSAVLGAGVTWPF